MSVLLVLIPAALCLGLIGLAAFFWCLRNRQFDDPEGAAVRILSDDDLPPPGERQGRGRGH
jgi:cbb3-type cytochrome oxidase maturation protein